MDQLQETPSTGWLDAVVSALRRVKDVGSKVPIFEPGSWAANKLDAPTLGGLVPEGALRGLDNISHGEWPMHMAPSGTGSNIPMWSKYSDGSSAMSDMTDIAGMLPIGTVTKTIGLGAKALGLGAKALSPSMAALMPVLKGLNQVPSKATELEAAEATANKLLEVATPGEIWEETGLILNPASGITQGRPQAKWLHETKPSTPPTQVMIDRVQAGERVPIREFRPDPELHTQYPWTGDVLVGNDVANPEHAARYVHYTDPPEIHISDRALDTLGPDDLNYLISHEVNHNINATTGQLQTLGQGYNPLTPTQGEAAKQMADLLRQKSETASLGDQVARVAESAAPLGSENGSAAAWLDSMGERLAELDGSRTGMTDAERFATVPAIEPGVPDNVARHLSNILSTSPPSAEAAVKSLLQRLRAENFKAPEYPSSSVPALYKGGDPTLFTSYAANKDDPLVQVLTNGP